MFIYLLQICNFIIIFKILIITLMIFLSLFYHVYNLLRKILHFILNFEIARFSSSQILMSIMDISSKNHICLMDVIICSGNQAHITNTIKRTIEDQVIPIDMCILSFSLYDISVQ